MHFTIFLRVIAALAAAPGTSARFMPGLPHVTQASLEQGQADPTTGDVPEPTISEDPWQCSTDNITQYFDVPKPTGNIEEEIATFGYEAGEACRSAAKASPAVPFVVCSRRLIYYLHYSKYPSERTSASTCARIPLRGSAGLNHSLAWRRL